MKRTVQLCAVFVPKDQFPTENPMDAYDMTFLSQFWDTLTPLSVESDEFKTSFLSNIGITKPKYVEENLHGFEEVYSVGVLCFTTPDTKTYEPIKPLAHLDWYYFRAYLANKVSLGFDVHTLRREYASPLNWLMLTLGGIESALEKEKY